MLSKLQTKGAHETTVGNAAVPPKVSGKKDGRAPVEIGADAPIDLGVSAG
jgi:hypothetical protein